MAAVFSSGASAGAVLSGPLAQVPLLDLKLRCSRLEPWSSGRSRGSLLAPVPAPYGAASLHCPKCSEELL